MGNSTFRGGAHPYEGKELSMDEPIRVMEPKTEMVFPMSQHIGAPATPTVAVGDTVDGTDHRRSEWIYLCQHR